MRSNNSKERNDKPIGFFPTPRDEEESLPEVYAASEEEAASPIESAEAPEEAPTLEIEEPAAPEEIAVPEEIPEEIPVPIEEPTPAPAPQEEEAPREYGAPQPLFEDIIPAGFSLEERKREREREKERIAAIKRAEAEEKRRQKEWEEGEKKRKKEEEADAKKQSKNDKKKSKSAEAIAIEDAEAAEIPSEENAGTSKKKKKEAPILADDFFASPAKEYTRAEARLRRKYKMNNDVLLSENDVVPGFVIAKGENIVRTYNCLSGKGGGTICLTNKRLLINAAERSEMDIKQVSGIKFSNSTNFNFLKFLFGLIFVALGGFLIAVPAIRNSVAIPYLTGEAYKSWFAYVLYPCGGVSALIGLPLLFTTIKTSFYFYVYARVETPFLECKSAALAKRERKEKAYKFMVAKPGKESDKAARELGALIIEVKDGKYDN